VVLAHPTGTDDDDAEPSPEASMTAEAVSATLSVAFVRMSNVLGLDEAVARLARVGRGAPSRRSIGLAGFGGRGHDDQLGASRTEAWM
jgi:hypothetical protein